MAYQFNFQAVGYCGGLTALALDTQDELQRAATAALTNAGLRAVSVVVTADQWDLVSRIFHNTFQYRLAAIVETDFPIDVAFSTFTTTLVNLTGYPISASNLTSGGPALPTPDSNPFPGIGDALSSAITPPLALVAIGLVAIAFIFWEAK